MNKTEVKSKSIIFSTKMVKAILEDRKTMTRRTKGLNKINKTPDEWEVPFQGEMLGGYTIAFRNKKTLETIGIKCLYKIGQILWVKETHYRHGKWVKNGKTKTGKQKWHFLAINITCIKYCDNQPDNIRKNSYRKEGWYKKPSIFMYRVFSRSKLEITAIRCERLQDITEEDAKKEGVWGKDEPYQGVGDLPTDRFQDLWDSINGKKAPWSSNPFVLVISFKRIK